MESRFKLVRSIFYHPLFAYSTIALLQLKVVWQMWDYKDLSSGGDAASYFVDAYRWFDQWLVNIIWSPLYTAFYGSLLHITSDAYSVSIIHRLIIVFAATMMVLALMRKLLPPSIAWLMAAWWAILPINFNTLYEIHLFSILPVLITCLVLLHSLSPWTRGGAIGIMAAATVLVRNEYLIATIVLLAFCILWDVIQNHSATEKHSIKTYILSYGVPLMGAAIVVLFFYSHSYIKLADFPVVLGPKHTLNICQIYAFGYQQRYSDWAGSPWTECMSLMKRQFGQELPTLLEAFKANPQAMLEHFLWNLSLLLNGIQLSLFNATSGSVNPDYIHVNLNANWVILPTLFIGFVIISGLGLLVREYKYWWNIWLRERVSAWFLLLSLALICCFVITPMQRPRPSYLFTLAIFLMALFGMALFIIAHRWHKVSRIAFCLLPVVMAGLLFFTPNYYVSNSSKRELLTLYRRFMPYQEFFANSKTVFQSPEYGSEICSYLRKKEMCLVLSDPGSQALIRQLDKESIDKRPIDKNKPDSYLKEYAQLKEYTQKIQSGSLEANLIYMSADTYATAKADAQSSKLINNPNSFGWDLIAKQNYPSNWLLLSRPYLLRGGLWTGLSRFPEDLLREKFKHAGIYQDGWGKGAINIELVQPSNSDTLVISGLIPLINQSSFTTQLRVQINEKDVANKVLKPGEFSLKIPVSEPGKTSLIGLYFSKSQKLPSPDGREVTVLLKSIDFSHEGSSGSR